MSTYCLGKCALNMLWKCLKTEIGDVHDVAVGIMRPGVVDTDMQRTLRSSECKEVCLFVFNFCGFWRGEKGVAVAGGEAEGD